MSDGERLKRKEKNMETKFCPLLKAAGFINGKETCSEDCAWYCNGCAMACNANSMDYIGDALDAIDKSLRELQDR